MDVAKWPWKTWFLSTIATSTAATALMSACSGSDGCSFACNGIDVPEDGSSDAGLVPAFGVSDGTLTFDDATVFAEAGDEAGGDAGDASASDGATDVLDSGDAGDAADSGD